MATASVTAILPIDAMSASGDKGRGNKGHDKARTMKRKNKDMEGDTVEILKNKRAAKDAETKAVEQTAGDTAAEVRGSQKAEKSLKLRWHWSLGEGSQVGKVAKTVQAGEAIQTGEPLGTRQEGEAGETGEIMETMLARENEATEIWGGELQIELTLEMIGNEEVGTSAWLENVEAERTPLFPNSEEDQM